MPQRIKTVLTGALLVACTLTANALQLTDTTPFQERQCTKLGWQVQVLDVGGMQRRVLWKGPSGPWDKGSIIVLHGGGGHHFQFCVANTRIVAPQVRFAELALSKGFSVFLLESTDRVSDDEGRLCGKVWDDEVRVRPNLDLPFIGEVIHTLIPSTRPAGSRNEIFMTGLSSGGYMTLRAATHFGNAIAAFALVSSGDPYGWHRICEKGLTARDTVHGAGFDNETLKQIVEPNSCRSDTRSQENPWDDSGSLQKPAFRAFHHRYDGVNDLSCTEKAIALLRDHGYPEVPSFLLDGDKHRSLGNHLWQDDYNEPLLEFFVTQLRRTAAP